jgi:hypothetical protein
VAAPTGAPTGLKVEVEPGTAELTWRSGGASWFQVFRRDRTAGEKEFVQDGLNVEGTKAKIGNLTGGHEYEFAVAAVNDGGTGPRSEPLRIRIPSAAPTKISARSDEPGTATVVWTEIRRGLTYRVQLRDATTGESWRTDPYPVTGTRYQTALLAGGHRYEFRLQLPDGTMSATATTTVR